MRAYLNIKFTEGPDIADVKSEGRRTRVGRIPRGESYTRFLDGIVCYADGTPGRTETKVVRNDRGYCKPTGKAATRRHLKRVDRALSAQYEAQAEGIDLKQVSLAAIETEAFDEMMREEASMDYYSYDLEDFMDYDYEVEPTSLADVECARETYFDDTFFLDYDYDEYGYVEGDYDYDD